MANGESLEWCDHQTEFDAKDYLRTRFDGTFDKRISYVPFYLKCYHEFYQLNGFRLNRRSSRLLEFGGGPALYSLISAAPHYKEICFAEYIPVARREVELWRDNESDAYDWSPYFKYVVQTLEEKDGKIHINDREDELRSKLTSILPCDILNDDPLFGESGPFDVIHSNFTLEHAFDTKDGFFTGLCRLKSLVKLDGYLLLLASIERTYYKVNGMSFSALYLKSDDIKDMIEDAGFSIQYTIKEPIPSQAKSIYFDCKAMEFFVCKRLI